MEFANIRNTITTYTHSGPAACILPKLEEAIEQKDEESIVYCLETILDWYESNIRIIRENVLVRESDHYYVLNLIRDILPEMKNYTFPEVKEEVLGETVNTQSDNSEPLIFLSHKSSDKKYGDALEAFIMGLGIKKEQLIYTSHPLHKIPLDENIYDYLRKNINRKVFMIILWSDEYLDSPACMNEMGAAWVVHCDYTNIYVPDFSFGNPRYHQCAVDTNKMGAVLKNDAHCKQNMLELKDKIVALFGLNVDEKITTYQMDKFMEAIT